MPFAMSGPIQSVLVQGTLYVGGGYTDDDNSEYIVMAYNISAGKWATLPPYSLRWFAMTAINNRIMLVGGKWCDYSTLLGVWSDDSKKWTHPYPDMTTPRRLCSAVVYKQYLVVAGGMGPTGLLSSVEIMNTDTKRWYAGSQTPITWSNMKTAILGDTCYFTGGWIGSSGYTNKMYSVSLPALVSQLSSDSSAKDTQPWKELPPLPVTYAAPVSISGSLLVIGGREEDGKAVHLYQPDAGEWVKAVDMPTLRYSCICAMITDKELLVAGGTGMRCLATTDIAQIC